VIDATRCHSRNVPASSRDLVEIMTRGISDPGHQSKFDPGRAALHLVITGLDPVIQASPGVRSNYHGKRMKSAPYWIAGSKPAPGAIGGPAMTACRPTPVRRNKPGEWPGLTRSCRMAEMLFRRKMPIGTSRRWPDTAFGALHNEPSPNRRGLFLLVHSASCEEEISF